MGPGVPQGQGRGAGEGRRRGHRGAHAHTHTRARTRTRAHTHTHTHTHPRASFISSARCQAQRVCTPHARLHPDTPETRSWISPAGTARLWHQKSRPWGGSTVSYAGHRARKAPGGSTAAHSPFQKDLHKLPEAAGVVVPDSFGVTEGLQEGCGLQDLGARGRSGIAGSPRGPPQVPHRPPHAARPAPHKCAHTHPPIPLSSGAASTEEEGGTRREAGHPRDRPAPPRTPGASDRGGSGRALPALGRQESRQLRANPGASGPQVSGLGTVGWPQLGGLLGLPAKGLRGCSCPPPQPPPAVTHPVSWKGLLPDRKSVV